MASLKMPVLLRCLNWLQHLKCRGNYGNKANNCLLFTLMCSIFRIRAGWIQFIRKNPYTLFVASSLKGNQRSVESQINVIIRLPQILMK